MAGDDSVHLQALVPHDIVICVKGIPAWDEVEESQVGTPVVVLVKKPRSRYMPMPDGIIIGHEFEDLLAARGPPGSVAVIDLRRKQIICTGRSRLVGSCLRCGACCEQQVHKCDQLVRHVDGTTSCASETHKPWYCWLYPLPGTALPEGCGYRWESV